MSLQNIHEGIWTPGLAAFQVRYNQGHLECRHEKIYCSERIEKEIQSAYGLVMRPPTQNDDPYYVYFRH